MANGRRVFGSILFILAALVFLAFVVLVLLRAYGDETQVGWINDLFPNLPLMLLIGMSVVALLLLIAIFTVRKKKDEGFAELEDPYQEAYVQDAWDRFLHEPDGIGLGPDVAVYNLPVVPQMFSAWEKRASKKAKDQMYTWPRTVQDAIYTIDNIAVSPDFTLRLRTLLAGPPGKEKEEIPIARRTPRKPSIKPESIPEPLRSRLLGGQVASDAAPEPTMEEIPQTGRPADGRAFLQELESTLEKRPTTATVAVQRAYYDYEGDVHNVEDIEGIGAIYGDKLRQAGVYTTARLCYEDAGALAGRLGVPRKTVETWQHMAELIKVSGIGPQYAEALARSGVSGIADLKKRSAATIAGQVNGYLESLDTKVLGASITEARVKSWQKASAKMRRVRLKIPEK